MERIIFALLIVPSFSTTNSTITLPTPNSFISSVIWRCSFIQAEGIDSENWLFESKLKEFRSSIPNLISRRLFNERRKSVSGLSEQIRSRMARHIDGGEEHDM